MDLGLPGSEVSRPTVRHRGPQNQQLPVVRDATGYVLDSRPLQMSGVQVADLQQALSGVKPLGFASVGQWVLFQDELAVAFAAAGLTDVSARLGGSSRSFFSSPYTRTVFPRDLRELRAQITAKHPGASRQEVTALYAVARDRYIAAGFQRPGPRPGKHFWDSRYLFGIDAAPCDYDIEVASDILDARMRQAAAQWRAANLGLEEGFHVNSSGQWRETLVLREFPELMAFKDRWQQTLGRPVDFECFDGHERLRFAARPDWWRLRGID